MKILLIQPPPPSHEFGDALPIGLVCIASFLRKHGMEVRVVDLKKQNIPIGFMPDIVGIGASSPYYKKAIACSKLIRKLFPNAKIVFGGDHFSAMPEDGIGHADFIVKGEGELAMLDICRGKEKEKIIEGQLVKILDDIPLPDTDLLDFIYKGREARLHIVGARGCPFDCVFCAEHSRAIRYHSVGYFIENLKILSERYNKNIFITDDVFTLDKERVTKICEEIIRQDLGLHIEVFGHVNCFDEENLAIMKKAGIHTISYGIESGNNDILKLINKNFTIEEAEEVIVKTAEAGLNVKCLYMIGNIGETKETIKDTVKFALKASKQRWCSFALPFPGTRFHKVAEQYGKILTKDWDKYSNKNMAYIPNGVSKKYMNWGRDSIVNFYDRTLRGKIHSIINNSL